MRAHEILIENDMRSVVSKFEHYITNKYNVKNFNLSVYNNETIRLDNIIVNDKKQGIGTAIMNELSNFADTHNKLIYLNPASPDDFHGTTSRSRLVKFYKRFGFYENKGRRKDFTYMGGMLRQPTQDNTQ